MAERGVAWSSARCTDEGDNPAFRPGQRRASRPVKRSDATIGVSGTEPGPRILITGAAGNLGSLLGRHLATRGYPLRLMYHRRPLSPELVAAPNVVAVWADLARPETIRAAVEGVDVVVHFAGVLFAPRPER